MSSRSRESLTEQQIRQIAEAVTVSFTCCVPGAVASGTGFVVSATEQLSWIMTNRHVLADIVIEQSEIYYPPTGQHAHFRILDYPPEGADLAIVETDLKFLEIPRISNRKRLRPGERLFTFGFPSRRPQWNTGRFRNRQDDTRCYHPRYVDSKYTEVCDLISEPGSSGSAVFDNHGHVVGVLSKATDRYNTPSYIVPIPYVRALLRKNFLDFVGVGEGNCETEYVGRHSSQGIYDENLVVRRSSEGATEMTPQRMDPVRRYDYLSGVAVHDRRGRPARRRPRSQGVEVQLCCAVIPEDGLWPRSRH